MSAAAGYEEPAEGGTTYLFVYGTLMTRARGRLGAVQRARLGLEGTSLGVATIAGQLINLGTYPGLIEPAAPGDVVQGELFRLDRPDEVISWLDSYEGVAPEPTPHDEYVRVLAPVRLATGEEVEAWVYRYRGTTSNFPVVAGGRWGD
jgi:gamma-glutamylcyclotransferase (GGCT)/AIG2-like uncharacterized protein YtfP